MIDQLRMSAPRAMQGLNPRTLPTEPQTDGAGEEFSSVIAGFARQAVATIGEGERAAAAGIAGKTPIQEVVDKVIAAEQVMQTAMAIREKAVSAWLEISRIPI